jgi:hypothetical protein
MKGQQLQVSPTMSTAVPYPRTLQLSSPSHSVPMKPSTTNNIMHPSKAMQHRTRTRNIS